MGRLHPGRLRDHPAGPGERVRHARRRRQVLRADPRCRRSGTTPARSSTSPNPRCKRPSPRTWPGPPSTRPAARSVTSPASASCAGATARQRPRHRRPPGLRQVRHHRRRQDRRADRRHQAAGRRRHPGRPGLVADQPPDGTRRSSTRRSTRALAGRHEGQAEASSSRNPTSKMAYGDQRSIPNVKCDSVERRQVPAARTPASRSTSTRTGSTPTARPARSPAPARTAGPSRAAWSTSRSATARAPTSQATRRPTRPGARRHTRPGRPTRRGD